MGRGAKTGWHMKVLAHHNGDDVFVAWKPGGFIPGCRGFALLRRRNGVEEVVSTWVGFAGEQHEEGERRASSNWPIQKYQWTDYMADPGDRLRYRVVPMVGPDRHSLHPATELASAWTPEFKLDHEMADGVSVYFNRGIVAAQWVSRRLGITATNLQSKKLEKVIATPGDDFREFLFGPLGRRLLDLLSSAAKQKRHVYAALYELHDQELEAALTKLGHRAHVVLANGSVKKKGEDQNAEARMKLASKVDLRHRMCAPRALGHNKFLVICDKSNKPRWVWTGSQNWTQTGLCTQANNSVLIESAAVAREFKAQWELLAQAGDETPKALKSSNSKPRNAKLGETKLRTWFTPLVGQVDLKEARTLIKGAKRAILFLMFNPGPKDTLLNSIIDSARAGAAGKRLAIYGAINQDPSTKKNNVELFSNANWERADYEVVLPAAIDEPTTWFAREMRKLPKARAMVHSKVVVIDPFSAHPVVITGSHNLGPSGTNDENLLVIRDAPGVAAAYASNIMAVYNQYRWRFRRHAQPKAKRWDGLEDGDSWQRGYLRAGTAAQRAIDFWVGE